MARRKYGSRPHSAAAYGQKPAEPTPAEQLPAGSEPAAPSPAAAADDTGRAAPDSHLREQLAAIRAGPEQAQPRIDPLDLFIFQNYPGLTEGAFNYLRQRPGLATQPYLVHAAHQFAQLHGMQPDTPSYFGFIDHLIQHHAAQAAPDSEPQPQEPSPQEAPQGHADGGAPLPVPPAPRPMAHIDVEQQHGPDHESEQMSALVAAPVSRSEFMAGHEPESVSAIRLSPAEREHARASGVDEATYASNKLKMIRAKKAGLIKD